MGMAASFVLGVVMFYSITTSCSGTAKTMRERTGLASIHRRRGGLTMRAPEPQSNVMTGVRS